MPYTHLSLTPCWNDAERQYKKNIMMHGTLSVPTEIGIFTPCWHGKCLIIDTAQLTISESDNSNNNVVLQLGTREKKKLQIKEEDDCVQKHPVGELQMAVSRPHYPVSSSGPCRLGGQGGFPFGGRNRRGRPCRPTRPCRSGRRCGPPSCSCCGSGPQSGRVQIR